MALQHSLSDELAGVVSPSWWFRQNGAEERHGVNGLDPLLAAYVVGIVFTATLLLNPQLNLLAVETVPEPLYPPIPEGVLFPASPASVGTGPDEASAITRQTILYGLGEVQQFILVF